MNELNSFRQFSFFTNGDVYTANLSFFVVMNSNGIQFNPIQNTNSNSTTMNLQYSTILEPSITAFLGL